MISCHDLGLDSGIGHTELWPAVIDRLAIAWGKDANTLRRLLKDRYTGLPRGRVTRPGRGYLILHGEDAPVVDWEGHVVRRFHLEGSPFKVLFDEHERMLPGDPQKLESILGIRGCP